MKKTWSNSKTKFKRNKKTVLITDQKIINTINILEAERERLERFEYSEQMFAYRMRHPYQAPKRIHAGRASRIIRQEIALLLTGKRTPDQALQVLVNEEVEQSRRMAYGNGF